MLSLSIAPRPVLSEAVVLLANACARVRAPRSRGAGRGRAKKPSEGSSIQDAKVHRLTFRFDAKAIGATPASRTCSSIPFTPPQMATAAGRGARTQQVIGPGLGDLRLLPVLAARL